MEKDGAAARRMKADVVALCSEGMRFIERNPILHSIAKLLKARLGENREILSANLKGGNWKWRNEELGLGFTELHDLGAEPSSISVF